MAFVSGGGGGAGLASAKSFAAAGAAVAVVDADADAAKHAAARLLAEGHQAMAIACDVSNEDEVETAIALTLEQLGSLDFAFNDLLPQARTWASTSEKGALGGEHSSWLRRGENLCMKHQLVHMRKHAMGVIVNKSAYSAISNVATGPLESGSSIRVIRMENVVRGRHNNRISAFTLYEKHPDPIANASSTIVEVKRLKAPRRRADLRCLDEAIAAAVLRLCGLSDA